MGEQRRRSGLMWGLLVCAAFMLSVSSTCGDDDNPAEPRQLSNRVYMRVKLHSSAKVLEGIVTRDYDLVADGAREMKAMSEASRWPRADDKRYQHYGAEFRRLCGKLIDLAEEENHEGMAFTHLQITSTCISCHEHVATSLTRAPDPRGPFQLIPNARGKKPE